MISKTATLFICKIRYQKVMEDGTEKAVTEQYVIDALSFTEAEERIIDEMTAYISGEFTVRDITQAPFREVFLSDDANDDRWFKAKLAFISIDEKTMREKRSNTYYLVQASTLSRAVRNIDEVMEGTMIDYLISSVAETPIMDVFFYKAKDDAESDRGSESTEED